MYELRDQITQKYNLQLIVHTNPDGIAQGINPFTHGSAIHTDVMKTQGLKQALDMHGFNAAFGGARRDEEKSRAKERVFSFRSAQHRWDPKNQRPELWSLYNTRMHRNESLRVFPMSNWTELDIWQYIYLHDIPIVPLYYAAVRPVVDRNGTLIMVDDDRMPLHPGEKPMLKKVRFRTLGCYPLTGAIESRGRHAHRDHPGNAAHDDVGTAGPHDRPRPVGVDGKEEAGGVLLMAHISDLIASDIHAYLHAHEHKSLLRFITCGSVDDGKSTLIGRLLYDSKMIFEDQLAALEADSKKVGTQGGELDFALLVDGLAAEREQGITIDVAYRFFSTDKRKFIVADTPGHEQYTRNMVTGASGADLAVILIDARKGVLTQTRRHSYLVSLIGIRKVVLAINKMDLVGYSEAIFNKIVDDYTAFARQIGIEEFVAIPVSGLRGDNIKDPSEHTDWYHGPTLMGYLETVEIEDNAQQRPLRMPVQWVNRPNLDFRGFAGTIASGMVQQGDKVRVLPSGRESTVTRIVTMDGDLDHAIAGQAITLTLADEIDISRGDVIARPDDLPGVADQFEAVVVWMSDEPMLPGRPYWLKIGTKQVSATITEPKYKVNVNTLEHLAAKKLELNEIGICNVSLDQSIAFDPYQQCRETGSFILIDRLTNATVGAGMIHFALRRSQNIHWQALDVNKKSRAALKGQQPAVLWLTGLSGAGKSTIANLVEKRLLALGKHTYLLDGDNVRHGLNRDLGFTDADRVENIRRVAEVSKLMADAGLIVMVSFISPFRAERRMARSAVPGGRVPRGSRRYAAGGRRRPRRQGPVQEGPSRRAQELHRHRFAVRSAGAVPRSTSTRRRTRPSSRPRRSSNICSRLGCSVRPSKRSGLRAADPVLFPASGKADTHRRHKRSLRGLSPSLERQTRARGKTPEPPLARLRLRLFRYGGKERTARATSISHPHPNPLPPGRERSATGRVRIHASDPASPVAIGKADTRQLQAADPGPCPERVSAFPSSGQGTGSADCNLHVSASQRSWKGTRSAACETSLDRKRNDAPLVRAHGELAAERRERALVAIGSFADAAADADGHGRAIEAEPFRVNDLVGMGDFTADADRVLAVGAQEVARALDDAAPHAQVAHAVRHLRDLHQDAARMTEGFVHVPQRARAAETRELEARRAVPLGDVAGLVHAHEIERHAARAGTLQRAQAMRHLLEARVVAVLQLLDVVTQFHGGRRKAPIRHDERTGRVVEETDAGNVARRCRLEPGCRQHVVAEVGEEQVGQLRRELECARRLGQVAVQRQDLGCRDRNDGSGRHPPGPARRGCRIAPPARARAWPPHCRRRRCRCRRRVPRPRRPVRRRSCRGSGRSRAPPGTAPASRARPRSASSPSRRSAGSARRARGRPGAGRGTGEPASASSPPPS